MPERPKLPLEIQAAIEDTRELAIKNAMAELSLLFDQASVLPISPIHMATRKPAKFKLQLRMFVATLFDIEASRYPQHASDSQQLVDWLNALATIIKSEVDAELKPFTALHDFHCSTQERNSEVIDVVRERAEHWLSTAKSVFTLSVTRGKIEPRFQAWTPRITGKAGGPSDVPQPKHIPVVSLPKTIGEQLDAIAFREDISHEELAHRMKLSRTVYFEVKAGRGGRSSRRKAEIYLSNVINNMDAKSGLNRD